MKHLAINIDNRFCVVVRPERLCDVEAPFDDLEWASLLMELNMSLGRKYAGRLGAFLEEPRKLTPYRKKRPV